LDQAPVLAVVGPEAPEERQAALGAAGAELLVAGSLDAALAQLGERGLTSIFLEGGPTLAAAFVGAGEVDEARTFVAPVLLGGGPSAGARGAARRTPLSHTVETVGEDTLIVARFEEW
jgi:diaminohydroxyphosphoribosylaminopyrimidine deaminase / 5-amino-6-(5-phosphoribosylamino)uracil reductase